MRRVLIFGPPTRLSRLAVLVECAVLTGGVVAATAYQGWTWLLVGAFVGVAALAIAVVRPVVAVCGASGLAVVESVQVPLGGLGALSATEVAFVVVAAGWALRAISGDPGVRFPQIADQPQIALVLAVLPSLAFGVEPAVVLRLTAMYTAFYLVFLTVKGFSPRELKAVLTALGLGAGALATGGLLDYLAGGGARVQGSWVSGRAAYAIADPNYYAAYLLIAAVPLLALLVAGRPRARPLALVATALSGAALVLTFSRGALLGAVLAVGIVVLARARTRAVSVLVVLTLALATAANLNPLLDSRTTEVASQRLSSITDSSSSTNSRRALWQRSIEVVQERPLGVGALQFEQVSRASGITERGAALENAHNSYLNLAVELGLFGLVAYLLWMARIAWDVVVEWRRRRPETAPLALAVGATMLGYSLQAATIVQYRVQTILATLFVLAGVAAAARAWPGDPASAGQDSRSPVTADGRSSTLRPGSTSPWSAGRDGDV